MSSKENREAAVCHEYSATFRQWTARSISIEIEQEAFARGSLRRVHRAFVWEGSNSAPQAFVAKFMDEKAFAKRGLGSPERQCYWDDAVAQADAAAVADKFNAQEPPKKVKFISASVCELVNHQARPLCLLEPFLAGKYVKYNDNWGGTFSARNTPQAFSHFSYEISGHEMLVCDIQGVGDLYTDPQIHTTRKLTACKGNKGAEGIDRFLKSHRCNTVCFALELPPLDKAQVTADVATAAAATPRSAQLSPRSTPRSIPVSRVENSPRLPDSSPKPPLPPGARSLLARVDALLAIAATNPSPDSSMLSSARTPSPSRASRGGPTTDLPSPLTLGGPARDDLFKQHERTLSSSPVLKSRPRSASLHDNFFSLEHPVSSASSSSDLPPVPRSYSITPPVPSHTTPTEDRPRSASVGRSPADGGDEFARLRLLIRSTDQTVFAARTAMYSNSKVI